MRHGRNSKSIDTLALDISGEGYVEGSLYRLYIHANMIEKDANIEEPLIHLEIRPNVLWLSEVKSLIADPTRIPKIEPVAFY